MLDWRRELKLGRARTLSWVALLVLLPVVCAACFGSPSGLSPSTTVGSGSTTVPSSLAAQLFNGGLKALNGGDLKAALEDFDAIIAIDQKDKSTVAEAYYDIGVVYAEEKNTASAITSFQKALGVNPKYVGALNDLALLERPLHPQVAISLFQRILKIDRNDPAIETDLGTLLIQQGQVKQGQAELALAAEHGATTTTVAPTGAVSATGATGAGTTTTSPTATGTTATRERHE